MRHRAEGARAVVCCASTPTAMATVVAVEERAGIETLATEPNTGESTEMCAGDALGQCVLQRLDNCVDDCRKWL